MRGVCVVHLGSTGNLLLFGKNLPGERWAFLKSPLNEDNLSLLRYAIWAQIARTCERMITTYFLLGPVLN